ncbi:hypothetical protein CT694_13885 [Bacillus wiedmannii bv. thuringiensis]|nr:hypothetical protein CT694_13885 [Bacillus wiedmannii bv. thuringiensis]
MEKESTLSEDEMMPIPFDYEISEQAFLDLWEEWRKPEELNNSEEIFKFLTELLEKTNGWVNWDHFSLQSYDYISKIEYHAPFTYIYWHDNSKYREKYLKGELDEESAMEWYFRGGNVTYTYTVLHINKLKFKVINNHPYLIFRVNLIPNKTVEKHLKLSNKNNLIETENKPSMFYKEFIFWEGNEKNFIKHACTVNNLPYYTGLIQPKENVRDSFFSRLLMLNETINEVNGRMYKVRSTIVRSNRYDYDTLFSQGNTIRRILEYVLKFFCLNEAIEVEIDRKYGNVKLSELRKKINQHLEEIIITQGFVDTANELSHDSGKVFSKEEILDFWNESAKIITRIYSVIKERL